MPQFNSYPSAAALGNSDTLLVYQGGAVKQATVQQVETSVSDASRWVSITGFTQNAASATSITLNSTTGLAAGLPLRVTQGQTNLYCIIESVGNNSVTVRGPAVNGGGITALAYGKPEQISEMSLFVASYFSLNTSTTVMASLMEAYFKWRGPSAYIVQACFVNDQADGTSNPRMNVLRTPSGGSAVRVVADNGNAGVDLAGAGVWAESTHVQSANYQISRGDSLELEVVTAGGDGGASNLTVSLTFVLA
jgi:hypothetical protein